MSGMTTKIWGPPGWLFLHCVTMGYPEFIDQNNPNHITKKENMRMFFQSLGHTLPCELCCKSYNQFINEYDTLLTDNVLSSRQSLARWFYDIHNKVNNKLGVDKSEIPTFEEFYNRYEMYRAKCNNKKKSLGCIHPKDNIKKHSHIKIVDENGNDYTIKTITNDQIIIENFYTKNDFSQLHLISDETKKILKKKAIYCVKKRIGNLVRAQCIIDNL